MKIPLTPAQYKAKVEQLKQEQGIALTGESGTVSKLGVEIAYSYDGTDLTYEVRDKPFLISEKHVEAIVTGWLTSKPAPSPAPSPSTEDETKGSPGGVVASLIAILFFAFSFLAAPQVKAQTVSQSVTNIYLGGVSYNPGADQKVAGTGIYARQLNTSGTYAFTLVDFLPGANKTVTSNVGVGVAQKIATIDGHDIFGTGATAISFSGSSTGWAWTGGALIPFRIKGNWYAAADVRFLKSSVSGGAGYQVIPGVRFGWGQ
jgi:hypothetical protein